MMRTRTKTIVVFGMNEDINPRLDGHFDGGWDVKNLERNHGPKGTKVTLTKEVDYR